MIPDAQKDLVLNYDMFIGHTEFRKTEPTFTADQIKAMIENAAIKLQDESQW